MTPLLQPGFYRIEVSINNMDYTDDEVYVHVEDSIQIQSIVPNFGSLKGQTSIILTTNMPLNNLGSSMYCAFGDNTTPLKIVSNSTSTCLSPPSETIGPVSVGIVRLSESHREVMQPLYFAPLSAATRMMYNYIKIPEVYSIYPAFGFQSGGTVITVSGVNFMVTTQAGCQFGSSIVRGIVLSNQYIRCTSPASSSPSAVDLSITLNGVDYIPTNIYFRYVKNIKLTKVTPARSTLSGGGLIEVYGTGFGGSSNLSCVFGVADPVPANILSDTSLKCLVPPYSREGTTMLRIGLNPKEFSRSGLHFDYQFGAVLYSVSPSNGLHAGGTPVVISGEGFTSTMQCDFGGVLALTTFSTSRNISCIAPPMAMNFDLVTLTVVDKNLVSGRTNSLTFYYEELPIISQIRPSSGPLTGNTQVLVTVAESLGLHSKFTL
ncbi:hypothetical protein AC1031_012537 [Aphanomyces cochlioides]|nr:hypothetical protein AC1031_012537 [Aphanomyces cochlioides]